MPIDEPARHSAVNSVNLTRRTLLAGSAGAAAGWALLPARAWAASPVVIHQASNGQLIIDWARDLPDPAAVTVMAEPVNGRAAPVARPVTGVLRLSAERVLVDFAPVSSPAREAMPIRFRFSGPTGTGLSDTLVLRPAVPVVDDGEPRAVVVHGRDADDQTRAAVTRLIDFVARATSVVLTVVPQGDDRLAGEFTDMLQIHVGSVPDDLRPQVDDALDQLSAQGFVLSVDHRFVVLTGKSSVATGYAVDDFLERCVGVRWLMPEEFGTHVPELASLSLTRQYRLAQPAIESRAPHPLHMPGDAPRIRINRALGERLRVHNSIEGHNHNLWRIFQPRPGQPSEHWPETHPEFYPLRNGVRYIPTNTVAWQPQFTEPGTVQAAIDYIVGYFDEDPDRTSFSLAVNDSGGFAEAEPDHPANPHRTNSFGFSDLSDIYFNWVNQVVEGVLRTHPDKWFGVLAYREVADPPSFRLHERVVPYLTKERLTWLDPEQKQLGTALTEAWSQVSDRLAFYDYVYGARYQVPRAFPHHVADVLQYGVDHGLAAYFGETDVTWAEGPKVHTLTKLLWNPHQDVDALLDDWYEHAVGLEAAPYVKRYFDHWEEFWTSRVLDLPWFQNRKDITYLSFYLVSYLAAVAPAEMAQCRSWLEAAQARVQTADQQSRLQVIMDGFEFYEATVLSYAHPVAPLATRDQALAMVELIRTETDQLAALGQRRAEIHDQWFVDRPILQPQQRLTTIFAEWSGLPSNQAWALVDYVRDHESDGGEVTNALGTLAAETGLAAQTAALILNGAAGILLTRNSSFEYGDESPEIWVGDPRRPDDAFVRLVDPEKAYTGSAVLWVGDMLAGRLHQTFAVEPGLLTTRVRYLVAPGGATGDTTWLVLDLLDAQGRVLESRRSLRQAYADTVGSWTTIGMMEQVPAEIDGASVVAARVGLEVNGHAGNGNLYIDDFEAMQSAATIPPGAAIALVEAQPDKVLVQLDGTPSRTPTAQDFTLVRRVNGAAADLSTATMSWDQTARTATFTVPAPITGTIWEDHVVVEAVFDGGLPVQSAPLLIAGDTAGWTQWLANPSFEDWPDAATPPADWGIWREPRFTRDGDARTGSYALLGTGMSPAENAAGGGGPRQLAVPITVGEHRAVVRVKAPSTTQGSVRWAIRLRTDGGSIVATHGSDATPFAAAAGEWMPVGLHFDVAAAYGTRTVTNVDLIIYVNDLPLGSHVLFDDAEVFTRE
ncbi:DUF4838 domain-containing protein [Microlunatus sp. Y2014]|uniref:DUF4838 domain-containing protein n=1 Tax=Microlunatus sp. Y2014 TaxID=3418488 RepID=UPI003DA708FE